MLPEEALEVLGLGAGATAVEIKEAYRDLVKVWHPDRFGSDLRLRGKAEEKLQQINHAHRVLQSYPGPRVYSSDSKSRDISRRRHVRPKVAPNKGRGRSQRGMFAWVFGGFGFAVVAIAAAIAFNYGSPKTRPGATVIQDVEKEEPKSEGSGLGASPQKEPSVSSNNTNHSNRIISPPFRVHPLSDAEAAQLETACGREKEMQDPTKYQDCVSTELGTSAPDMSTLSADDRSGIQSACRKTKREGSAAYNRCLTRMVKLLTESSRP